MENADRRWPAWKFGYMFVMASLGFVVAMLLAFGALLVVMNTNPFLP